MEKIIQAVFDNEADAFAGLKALQELDLIHDLSLGESYLLTKSETGETSIKSAKDKAVGSGVAGGALVGGLVGLLAGPLGFIVGVAGGMIVGSAGETLRAEDRADYFDVVLKQIPNGKSVLIAHIWEDWQVPVDNALEPIAKMITRFEVHNKVFDVDYQAKQYEVWINNSERTGRMSDEEKQKRIDHRVKSQKKRLTEVKKQ
ncbi:MAG: DUF1269 domain-containing protein [Candidatus Pedobacter colombiensis]|uniref:DUF1269 domain-containing protein n=1 Tax=Candidatus Pedobacter colombiensis TaxID=3121371 RepID=A0AAJ6B5T4_9SPHI|nr:DUF1269 domain-containing protein [Pedobacter sp.]WEK18450.1 MAG: DUF1269 domain-containing protein [Pedobacter sp.]